MVKPMKYTGVRQTQYESLLIFANGNKALLNSGIAEINKRENSARRAKVRYEKKAEEKQQQQALERSQRIAREVEEQAAKQALRRTNEHKRERKSEPTCSSAKARSMSSHTTFVTTCTDNSATEPT